MQNLPVNGRQMSQLMLQAPGSQNSGTGTWQDVRFSGRAVEQNAIRYDGVEGSAIIDAAPGNLERRNSVAVQAAGEPRERAGVPRRVEQLPGGVRHRHRRPGQRRSPSRAATRSAARLFEYYRNDKLDAPNYFDSTRNADGSVIQLPKSKLNQHQFGGSIGGPIAEGPGVLLRQLRRLSAQGRRELRGGRAERRGVGARGAGDRARCGRASRRPARCILPGASASPDFDIAQLQGLQDVKENSFSARVDFRINANWTSYVRVFHDQGEQTRPEGVSGRVVAVTDNPTNAIFNLQGTLGSGLHERVQGRLQRGRRPTSSARRRRSTASTSAPSR